jgi:hypothetical protein
MSDIKDGGVVDLQKLVDNISKRKLQKQEAIARANEEVENDPRWSWGPADPRLPPELVTWAGAKKALRRATEALQNAIKKEASALQEEASALQSLTLLLTSEGQASESHVSY